ncbi:Hpt domain-containing protein [Aquimarina sp. AU474]|uniref:Hpt domain-containing protein n=1 Tax=Aquimarina sp. AU474 TaxID=2108529 RepID=UPI000D69CC78|nr:histidine kinase [Aquimarina sp. AU474]
MEEPNLSVINTLSGGDKTFEEKIFNVIKREFPEEKDQYFDNLKNENLTKAAEDVHKLKHKISILGLEKSYEIATDYEKNLKQGTFGLKEDFEKILQTITQYITTL